MSIGERILKKRKELNLNQTGLAKKAGLQPPAISQYESGHRSPSYDALVKLSGALHVTIDYLVSGIESNEQITDSVDKLLLKMLQSLEPSKKQSILNYIFLESGHPAIVDFFSTDPKQYARYIFNTILNKELPVDVYKLAEHLKLTIIIGDLQEQTEAILFKKSSTIVLDRAFINKNTYRIKFGLATLIGHYILPWHLESTYYLRKNGQSTLKTEDIDTIEATMFATNLITPAGILEKDLSTLIDTNVSLQELTKLAEEKYKVSVTSLCNRLIEYDKNRFALIISEEFIVKNVLSGNLQIEEHVKLHPNSKAFELLNIPNNDITYKEGLVNSDIWIHDTEKNKLLYESSVYNPEFKSVMTLLTKL